jgi:ABC-type transport system involved in Fe-S cluster assembly fused permease/ATPase subunit
MRTLIDISQRPVKKSCLMIAHRLNTIKHADHIIVLSKAGNIPDLNKRERRHIFMLVDWFCVDIIW